MSTPQKKPFYKDTYMLCVIALLCAMNAVLRGSALSLQITPTIKITFGFLPVALSAMLYGIVPAMCVAVLGDVAAALIMPTGGYIVGLTITEALKGLIYGYFLYHFKMANADADSKFKSFLRGILPILIAQTLIALFCHTVLNTLWLRLWGYFADKALGAVIWGRVIKNALMLPFEIVLLALLARVPVALRKARVI